jgi:pyruvate kinase
MCTVQAGGTISDHKGCNIPKGNLSVEVVTPKDKKDLELIAKLNPEFLAASFIETADDIKHIRSLLKQFGNENIKIIAKIERPRALVKLDEIIEETDGIMVARGDLGVEIDTWEVPVRQKEMCRKCNAAGKPVIVATQMLESMTQSPRPTRAEANDVFNAVLDGADAVMLSGETSVGQYPVQAVQIMDNIVAVAEKNLNERKPDAFHSRHLGMTECIATGAFVMSNMMVDNLKWNGKIIVVAGPPSGYVARMVSKYRPAYDIIAITEDMRTARELNLLWGVRSVCDHKLTSMQYMEERNAEAVRKALELKLISEKDYVLVVARSCLGKHVGSTSAIYYVKEVVERSDRPFTDRR